MPPKQSDSPNAAHRELDVSRRGFLFVSAGLALGLTSCRSSQDHSDHYPKIPFTTPAPKQHPTTKNSPQTSHTVRVIPRDQWTKRPVSSNADPMNGVQYITLHHTGEHLSSSGISDLEVVRRIERYHADHLGWAAIGYHFLIGRDGIIYEGRPLAWQGAHCGGDNNKHNIGITLIGHFDTNLPSEIQLNQTTRLLNYFKKRYKIPSKAVFGHRDWKPTICPGSELYNWLKMYRKAS